MWYNETMEDIIRGKDFRGDSTALWLSMPLAMMRYWMTRRVIRELLETDSCLCEYCINLALQEKIRKN